MAKNKFKEKKPSGFPTDFGDTNNADLCNGVVSREAQIGDGLFGFMRRLPTTQSEMNAVSTYKFV